MIWTASFVKVGNTSKSPTVKMPRIASVESIRPHCFRIDRRSLKSDEEVDDDWEEEVEGKEEEGMMTLSLFMVALCAERGRTRGGQSV